VHAEERRRVIERQQIQFKGGEKSGACTREEVVRIILEGKG